MKQMHFINLKFTTLPLTRPRAARDRQRDGGPRGTPAPGAPTSFTPQTHSPTTTKAHPPTHPHPPVCALAPEASRAHPPGPTGNNPPPLHQPPTPFTPPFSRVPPYPPSPISVQVICPDAAVGQDLQASPVHRDNVRCSEFTNASLAGPKHFNLNNRY